MVIATPMKNCNKELHHYFGALQTLTYPLSRITLAILESDSVDGTQELLTTLLHDKGTLFKNVIFSSFDEGYVSPADRHSFEVQLARRQVLARARNRLLSMIPMKEADYVLWMDVDAVDFPPSLIEDLISLQSDVVAAHVVWSKGGVTYDRNSWWDTEWKKIPTDWELSVNKPTIVNSVWQPVPSPLSAESSDNETRLVSEIPDVMFEGYTSGPSSRLYFDDFRKIVKLDKFQQIPLHGVGTACLLVASKVFLSGLEFPVQPYKKRVESEGFGLLANDAGFKVVGLPLYEVVHKNSIDKPGNFKDVHDLFTLKASVFCFSLFFAFLFLLYFKRKATIKDDQV